MTKDESRERNKLKMRAWRAMPGNAARQREGESKRRRASPRYTLNLGIHNARKRAEVSISIEDLMGLWARQNGKCAVTGIKMTWGNGRITETSISIDRIDQQKPYDLDNIRLVCFAVNCFRQGMSDQKMTEMARAIIAHQEGPTWLGPQHFQYGALE